MNNLNNGMGMYPGGMYNVGGYAPSGYTNQPTAPQKTKNVLTPEEIKTLRKNTDTFSLGLTSEEMMRGICFHADENGYDTLRENPDGTYTCSVCGYTFDPQQNCTEDDLQKYVKNIIDVLQTIKLLYKDMPSASAREYFQIIPLINKIPKLFKIASDNYNRHENYNNYRYNGTPNTINLYNMLNNGSLNNGFMGQPMQPGFAGQPSYVVPMGQPGVQPVQPPLTPFNQQQTNGFGYGAPVAPQTGYQPTTTGFGYVPNQTNINNQPTGTLPQQQNVAYGQQAPLASQVTPQVQQPAAAEVKPATVATPVAATATSDGQEVKVNSTFKS